MRWLWRGGVLGLVLVLVMVAATVDGQTTALAGVIDFHVHSGPDSRPRSVSDLEIARIAKRAGMSTLRDSKSGCCCSFRATNPPVAD